MGLLNTKQEYLDTLEGPGRQWLQRFLDYMDHKYPDLAFVMFRSRPMCKGGKSYVLFSVAKAHFTVHALNFDVVEEMKSILPGADFGKGCVKVKFKGRSSIPALQDFIDRVVERNRAGA